MILYFLVACLVKLLMQILQLIRSVTALARIAQDLILINAIHAPLIILKIHKDIACRV